MSTTAPFAPGDRLGFRALHLGHWLPAEYLGRHPVTGGELIRLATAGAVTVAIWPDDIGCSIELRPAAEVTFLKPCRACRGRGHYDPEPRAGVPPDLSLAAGDPCPKCNGAGERPYNPWKTVEAVR